MRKITLLITICLAFSACETKVPADEYGTYQATFASTKSEDSKEGQVCWSAGDKVVLSNCTSKVLFEDGEMVANSGAEFFTVVPEMISADALTIHFDPSIPVSGKLVLLTARDFGQVVSIGVDGKIEMNPRREQTSLNYVATAVAAADKFFLEGVSNVFKISVVDKRVKYLDVEVGYASFEMDVEAVPVSYYFPLAPDELISDGVYASAYDEACDKIFSEHYPELSFRANRIVDLGTLMDYGDADKNLIQNILKDNSEVEKTYNLEGQILKKYLDEVQYDNDYSYTKIKNYVPKSNESASVQPAYVSVKNLKNASKIYLVSDRAEIQTRPVTSSENQAVYDLIPGRTYRYGVVSVNSETGAETLLKKGCFATEGRVRVIKTRTMHNVRDVGGWEGLDGKHIRYGMLLRGGEVIDKDDNLAKYDEFDYVALIEHALVDYDMDFRTAEGAGYVYKSPLGIEFLRIPLSAYDSIVLKKDRQIAFKQAILQFIANAKKGKCTYVHCQGGADRTGTFVFFIEGLLGVSDSDLCKDYEITSFYYHKERNDPERYLPMVQALLKNYSKDGTVGNAIYNCSRDMGITDQNIRDLRDLMLE